jgi:hypothetical protein
MADKKTVRLKHSELAIIKQLCDPNHPVLARKIKHYMNQKATKATNHE